MIEINHIGTASQDDKSNAEKHFFELIGDLKDDFSKYDGRVTFNHDKKGTQDFATYSMNIHGSLDAVVDRINKALESLPFSPH